MDPVSNAASVITLIQISSVIITLCSQYVLAVKDAREDIERFQTEVETLCTVLKILQGSIEGDNGTEPSATKVIVKTIEECFSVLKDLERQLKPGKLRNAMKNFGRRALKWPFSSKDVDKIIATLERHKSIINLALNTDIKADLGDMKQDQHLSKLLSANDAAFNSAFWQHQPSCLPGTRVELLRQIHDWSNSANSASIYWLSGMAGTGKSTISRSLAKEWSGHGQQRLGASFFFSRGHAELSHIKYLFSTVAFQLSNFLPALRPNISKSIAENPDIFQRGLRDQWQFLVFRPLSTLNSSKNLAKPIIVLIDALDECDGEKDVRLMLELLGQLQSLDTVRVRVFITSRPELPIRLGFRRMAKDIHQDFVLHDIAESIIKHDISLFLHHEFKRIREYRELPDDWPEKDSIDRITQNADRLFIYAATVCRFIDHPKLDPMERLSNVLNIKAGPQSSTGVLDGMYMQVLKVSLLEGNEEEDAQIISREFRSIVGTIVLLYDSLSITALAGLLGRNKRCIKTTLDWVGSVVDASNSHSIRLLHPSFRDFLLDGKRCTDSQFLVDGQRTHLDIFFSCLAHMSRNLRRDICDLQSPGILSSEIDSTVVEQYLPLDVQYACCYWVDHLEQCKLKAEVPSSSDRILKFFRIHFLHWLEALGLIQMTSEGVLALESLQNIITTSSDEFKDNQICTELLLFIHDAKRFLLKNRFVIEVAPLQTYCSAMIFSPRMSNVRNQFWHEVPAWVENRTMTQIGEDWDPLIQVCEGHYDDIVAVAFSPDGKILASASDDYTVRLWDPSTGACVNTLEDHSNWVTAVAFSPDGKLLASTSYDRTVRLWDPSTGACVSTLEGHSHWVTAVAFSSDGKLLASTSYDRTVRLWDPSTGSCVSTLEVHSTPATAVAFSPDGKLLASTSDDNTVRLLNPSTGACVSTLEGHSTRFTAAKFSPDGKLFASASTDNTVRLWDPLTGACVRTLEGHSDWASAVAFSPDGKLLASASADKTVILWDPSTGAHQSTLEGHTYNVREVAFSPDGRLLASISTDNTVRLWDSSTGACQSILAGDYGVFSVIAFSPDGKLLASALSDHTVRFWDPSTRASQSTLTAHGHSAWVTVIAFSQNGKILASASTDNTVRLWDPSTGACVGTLEGHTGGVYEIAFSPDGKCLASVSTDNTVRLWDPSTGACVNTLTGHPNSADIWDPYPKACVSTLEGDLGGCHDHVNDRHEVAFSPDGKLLASASSDGTVRLWDPSTGECQSTLEGHTGDVYEVTFSPDGKRLASASYDKTIRLWDISTNKTTRIFNCSELVFDLSFCTNGAYLETRKGNFVINTIDGCYRPHTETKSRQPLSISVSTFEDWVQWKGHDLLWLPVGLRPFSSLTRNNILAMGALSGKLTILAFDYDFLPFK